MDFGKQLSLVRERAPLVQCITNFVTVNDCANIVLAAGGSPSMADDVREAAEAAGMTKPSTSQICYLDMAGGDSAIVYQQEEPSVLSSVLTSLNHGVYAVVEYFK